MKNAIEHLMKDLKRKKQKEMYRKVARITLEWTERHDSSFAWIPELKRRIVEETGVDVKQFIDEGTSETGA